MAVVDIVQRVGQIFDDLDQERFDKDYILGWLAIHNEDVENILENLDLSYDTHVYVLTPVPVGTTDLSQWQAPGQLLANMMYPVALEWRLPGQNDTQWNPVNWVDKVIDTNLSPTGVAVSSSVSGIASVEWRDGILYISPSSVPVEIRVRVEELPAVLDVDSVGYIKGMTNVLAYGVAEKIAATQGSGASKLAPIIHGWYDEALDKVADRLVKEEQNVPRRMGGRRSGLLGPNWRTPMG